MRLRNLTRRLEIGANSYLLESGEHRVVLDAGMHPKYEGNEALPNFASVAEDSLDGILITHAHHDHIGSLPLLQRSQPETDVYMTEFTAELCDAMLHNSVSVMVKERTERGLMDYPLFTHKEVEECAQRWTYVPLRRSFPIGFSDMKATFHEAGHIIGSAAIEITERGKTLLYTGDVNFEPQTISLPAELPKRGVDVLIMETTRGDTVRPADYTRLKEKERLGQVIRETYDAGGSVLIPVFALGKAQEVMVMLHELHQMDLIPEMPLHIGGLSAKVTELHDKYASDVHRAYPGFSLMEEIDILVPSMGRKRNRAPLLYEARCIYALSSGMMTEKTTSNQFASRGFLENPKNTVAFVGYTDPDCPGWRVRHAKPGEEVSLDLERPPVPVHARIESFDFSAHANREDLLSYACGLKPKKILLVHGDEPAQLWFKEAFVAALPGTEVIRPVPDQWIDLW